MLTLPAAQTVLTVSLTGHIKRVAVKDIAQSASSLTRVTNACHVWACCWLLRSCCQALSEGCCGWCDQWDHNWAALGKRQLPCCLWGNTAGTSAACL